MTQITEFHIDKIIQMKKRVGGQAVLGRQLIKATPWLTERNGAEGLLIKNEGLVSQCGG